MSDDETTPRPVPTTASGSARSDGAPPRRGRWSRATPGGRSRRATPAVVRLSSPADVLGVLPYRLGFHPRESLVLVCLQGPRRRDMLVMRIDLPGAPSPGGVGGGRIDDDELEMAAEMARRVAHVDATAVFLVVYTDDPSAPRGTRPGPTRWTIPWASGAGGVPTGAVLVEAVTDALEAVGVEVTEALLVQGGRWWSYLCSDPSCCPDAGTPVPEQPTAAALHYAAEVVAGGASVLDDREALARTVEASNDPETQARSHEAVATARDVLAAALAETGPTGVQSLVLARLAALRRRFECGDQRLAADDVALVVLGMRDVDVRDAVVGALLAEEGDELLGLLVELARAAADVDAAPVCTVLGWVAYACGQGALAAVAVDRALRVEPGYSMALLLEHAMDQMIPPEVVRAVAARAG